MNELQRHVFKQKDLRSEPIAGAPSQRDAAAAVTLNQGTISITKFEYLNQSVRLEYLNQSVAGVQKELQLFVFLYEITYVSMGRISLET